MIFLYSYLHLNHMFIYFSSLHVLAIWYSESNPLCIQFNDVMGRPQVTYRSEKYAVKCIYFVSMEHTLYYEHLPSYLCTARSCITYNSGGLTHKISWTFDTQKYIFSESAQSKDSTGTVPKPNNTEWANYTGRNIKINMYFR